MSVTSEHPEPTSRFKRRPSALRAGAVCATLAAVYPVYYWYSQPSSVCDGGVCALIPIFATVSAAATWVGVFTAVASVVALWNQAAEVLERRKLARLNAAKEAPKAE